MNYASLNLFECMNGPGVRVSLFVSGCTLNCPGCFNKPAHNFKHGEAYTPEVEQRLMDTLADANYQGLSVLGGDPLEPKNYPVVLKLCQRVKRELPGKDIWLWTGRTMQELRDAGEVYLPLFEVVDALVDGRFMEDFKTTLRYRGSSNQMLRHRGVDF